MKSITVFQQSSTRVVVMVIKEGGGPKASHTMPSDAYGRYTKMVEAQRKLQKQGWKMRPFYGPPVGYVLENK